jgi:hypothetical protein
MKGKKKREEKKLPFSMLGVDVPGSLFAALRKMRSKTSLPKVSKISVIKTNLLG